MPTPALYLPPPRPRALRTRAICAGVLVLTMGSAAATPFSIVGPGTTAQTLGKASGETGTVAAGQTLTVGGAVVAVTISGNNATLTNLGTITQSGNGRAIRDNTGVANLVVNNGSSTNGAATIRTVDNDVIQMNVPAASVVLNNYGTLVSLNASAGGAQAVDFSAVALANTVNNFAGAVITASEADAVRPGANGVVSNAGTIRSTTRTPGSSDAIDGQANSGLRIENAATGLVDGARHGITGAQANAASAYTMSVSNAAGGLIRGNNGAGINIDGVNAKQLVTVVNHGAIVGNGVTGDGDGVDVDGMVAITNTGTIRSTNAVSAPASGLAYSEGISAGGGTIVNSGTIEGLVAAGNANAVGRGITLVGNDSAGGTRDGIYGNTSVVNQRGGVIRGDSDAAIIAQGAASGYTITIDNNAGATILGGGAANAAIRTVADRTVVSNAGTIDGGASGKAIELSSANNTVIISGGSAHVVGSIDGGAGGVNALVVDAGAGNAFAYDGMLANFASVTIRSGAVTLSAQSTYAGQTVIDGGASLTLAGAGRLSADSALVLAGGLLRIAQTGGAQTFASFSLLDNSTMYYTDAPLTFNAIGAIVAGKTLSLTDLGGAGAIALRFLGDLHTDAAFLQLMAATSIGAGAVRYSFDGRYTNVTDVPEPGTAALLAGGLALLGAANARARRRP